MNEPKVISSSDNELYKFWKSLLKKKYRYQHRIFMAEGIKLTNEAVKSDCQIVSLLFRQSDFDKIKKRVPADAFPVIILKDSLFDNLSSMNHPEGVISVTKMRTISAKEIGKRILILDGINDPGNLGTIIRSAEAFQFTDILLLDQTVDPYHPKVLRASMGSIFRMHLDLAQIADLKQLQGKGYELFAASLMGSDSIQNTKFREPLGLVIGNETHGLREELEILADQLFYIPMAGQVESLNAGIAAAIAMYHIHGFHDR